jgi:hypothetical protein
LHIFIYAVLWFILGFCGNGLKDMRNNDELMINGKLMILLRSLSTKNRMRFRKFLTSPIFNESEQMVNLFSLFDENIITINKESSLTKKQIWAQLYGESVYNDDRLRRLFSELNKLIMQFLAFEEYQNDHSSEASYLLPAINKSSLQKHFIGVVRQTKDQLRNEGFQNAEHHYTAYQIEKQSSLFLERTVHKNKELEHSENADFHLDCYYILRKLWHYIGLLILKDVRSIEMNFHLFPDFLNHVAGSKFIEVPTIEIYYNTVLAFLDQENDEQFLKCRALLDKNGKYFRKEELQSIYLAAQNYCAFRINKGDLEYYRELFNIYKTLIEESLVFSKGVFNPGVYKNIITVGLMVDEPKWVESFIQEYSQFLPKENQDNDQNYNLAKVYFHEKDYNKVISQLREVEYKNLVYALGGKLMLLKTYYELKEVNALDSLIDSFRIYLHRNKLISRDVRQQYMNVLRFVRKLPLEKTYDKEFVQKLRGQIEGCKALAAKQWLLEKVSEF